MGYNEMSQMPNNFHLLNLRMMIGRFQTEKDLNLYHGFLNFPLQGSKTKLTCCAKVDKDRIKPNENRKLDEPNFTVLKRKHFKFVTTAKSLTVPSNRK